jgi:hypothetical protein
MCALTHLSQAGALNRSRTESQALRNQYARRGSTVRSTSRSACSLRSRQDLSRGTWPNTYKSI